MTRMTILCRSMLLLAILVAAPPVATAQTFGGDEYMLMAKHSGKCLDVAWSAMNDGGDVVQSLCTGTDNQRWRAYWGSISSPTILVAKHSGKALDVLSQSFQHAADVVQWAYGGFRGPAVRTSQWWRPVYWTSFYGVPFFVLVNENSGHCLDVAWSSQADGGNVLQAQCTGTDNQLWAIYRIKSQTYGGF